MQTSVLWLVVPIIVGLSQPLIWQMNLRVARHTGNMESAVILHIIGAVFGLSLALGGLRGGWEGGGKLSVLGHIPVQGFVGRGF